jgi:hypothetical protein
LAILFIPFGIGAPRHLDIVWISNLLILSEPDEGYSRNVPDEGYSRNVPDEGYSRNVLFTLLDVHEIVYASIISF